VRVCCSCDVYCNACKKPVSRPVKRMRLDVFMAANDIRLRLCVSTAFYHFVVHYWHSDITAYTDVEILCSSLCWLLLLHWTMPSVLRRCWLGGRKGIRPVKNMGGWWRWALVSPDGVALSRMVSVSASVYLPLHHKVQKLSSGTGSPRWSRKKGRKMVVVWWLCSLSWQAVCL